jgi:hypothetical protein
MWNAKTKVILVITGTTRSISKSFQKYLSNIPREYDIKELQKKTATLVTAESTNVKE